MENYSRVTHVIFDVDGLILDTEKLYTQITERLCNRYGTKFTWELKVRMMGKKEEESAQILIDSLNLPITVEEYIEQMRSMQEEVFPSCALMPGAEKLIRHLHNHSIPICVATGSDTYNYGLKTQAHQELFGLFHHAVLSSSDEEVKKGKPAPDCFLVAAQRFGENPPLPSSCLVFEDAYNGVEAALSAGMSCIWVPDKKADRKKFADKVTLTLNSLTEFQPELFHLPPYKIEGM